MRIKDLKVCNLMKTKKQKNKKKRKNKIILKSPKS